MRSLAMIRPLSLAAVAALVLACGDKGDDPAASSGGDTDDSGTSDGSSDGSSSDSASASDSNSGTSSGTSAGTTDGTSGTSTSAGSSDTGMGFIEPPDGGVVGQCDPGLQDCPNANEKCTAYATMPGTCCVDANKCVPVIGNGVAGEDCNRTEDNDDCAKGFFCTTKTSGSTGMGFCEQLCVAGDDTSCDAGTCIVYNDGVLPLCRVECDPLLQNCDPGFGCYPAQDTFVCGKPANNEGEGDDGSPCSTLRSCLPGLACVNGTAVSGCAADGVCCTPFCDLSGPDPCTDPAEDCVAWFTAGNAPPQYENVGACLIPQ